jgi:hypothetical protein
MLELPVSGRGTPACETKGFKGELLDGGQVATKVLRVVVYD